MRHAHSCCSTEARLLDLLRGLRELMQVKCPPQSPRSGVPRAEAASLSCVMLVDYLTSLSSNFNSIQGLREDIMEEQKGLVAAQLDWNNLSFCLNCLTHSFPRAQPQAVCR